MKLSSKAFEVNGMVPSRYTCDGDDINPPLNIEGVPPEAKSLVLIMDDPSSSFGNFLHWMLWDVDPKTTEISEGASSIRAIQGVNDFGNVGYGGPCPSYGRHRYEFRLYALDTMLNLDRLIKRDDIETAIAGHIYSETELTCFYERSKPDNIDIV